MGSCSSSELMNQFKVPSSDALYFYTNTRQCLVAFIIPTQSPFESTSFLVRPCSTLGELVANLKASIGSSWFSHLGADQEVDSRASLLVAQIQISFYSSTMCIFLCTAKPSTLIAFSSRSFELGLHHSRNWASPFLNLFEFFTQQNPSASSQNIKILSPCLLLALAHNWLLAACPCLIISNFWAVW